MRVTVYLKDGRSFAFRETAVFEDIVAGRIILGFGQVSGGRLFPGRTTASQYRYDDWSSIAYCFADIDRLEIKMDESQ